MLRGAFENLERLAGGLGTAFMALITLVAWILVGAACLLGVGLLLVPLMVAVTRSVAERERARLHRLGVEIVTPYLLPRERVPGDWRGAMRAARADLATMRDLRWLAVHATLGFLVGVLGVLMPVSALREITYPLWWNLLPKHMQTTNFSIPVTTWPAAIATSFVGFGVLIGLLWLLPRLARLQARPALALLAPHPSIDLSERVARLTETRAGALRAHAAELRRIERSLHDGAQNRLMAVVVTVAAAKRALARDPARAVHAMDRAQAAAEQALAELRGVVRGILPPILADRGLSGALDAVAAGCSVPCSLTVGGLGHMPLSVETTAYFTVAEALTNVSRHSGARRAEVEVARMGATLRIVVRDDGKGGAREESGSGLAGIRRRVEALDGTMALSSPEGGPTVIEVELPCES
ncbi:sensor histidine kinase [Sinosporangium siamense]|uniref:histidine kinase n=1 Tax=Sinosporangium siamense TaxID=1367973 RepID=A0A919RQL9_9ACTN|nr:sensor domain-containing protein [Sinosporangium siamense]GII97482.1 histidine kinase [Sinosporangium siamense]